MAEEFPLGPPPSIDVSDDEDCDCEDGVLTCSNCAEPVDLDWSHCPSCGKKLHW